MVYIVFYKTSSFVGYCFLSRYSIHPRRHDVFSFMLFVATLVKFQICSFIVYKIGKKEHDMKTEKSIKTWLFKGDGG